MFVIQVTPLIRGTKLESLTYFSSTTYPIGTFLSVPIRGKTQTAVVIETKPVSTTKTALKAATFSLRKLPHQPEATVLPGTIRRTAEALTSTYPASVGALLFSLLPPDIRNGSRGYPVCGSPEQHEDSTPQLLTTRLDERYISYQGIIRSTFAKRGSVLVVVPSAAEITAAANELGLGIDDRLVVFSPQKTKRQRDAAYRKFADTESTKLVITTPSHAYLERPDLCAIIIEQSASGHYTARQRPYLDHREALITYARIIGCSVLLGDTVPRTEEEVHRRAERYLTYGEPAKRLAFTAPLSIITQKDAPKPDQPFRLFSDELVTSVTRALEGRGHVFFYAARRGLAPVVVCIDCGHIFRCPDSNTPYSLVRTTNNGTEQRWFVSSTSGRRVRAADVCSVCGSWRLRERGIGIQQVSDEWQKLAPETNVVTLDNTTANTPKQAAKLAEQFFAQRSGGILIGTQLALPFLHRGIDVSAVISLDAARAIPTWRADESLFRLLLKLRECTAKEVLVQTRSDVDNLLIHASRGAVERFYDDEIALREMLQYPPFSTFILLTWTGSAAALHEREALITEQLQAMPVQYYNSPHSTASQKLRHGLIRMPTGNPAAYTQAIAKLATLPPYVKIEVNPERIV